MDWVPVSRDFQDFGAMQSPFARERGIRAVEIGRAGEIRAERFLRREMGFPIVARNWRRPGDRRDEIDLVCRDRDVLVFVEVRTRSRGALVAGYHSVDGRKRRVLRRAIKAYLSLLPVKPPVFRFDVVEVEIGGPIRHYGNVELFSKHYRP
jgi:putative endonuclease